MKTKILIIAVLFLSFINAYPSDNKKTITHVNKNKNRVEYTIKDKQTTAPLSRVIYIDNDSNLTVVKYNYRWNTNENKSKIINIRKTIWSGKKESGFPISNNIDQLFDWETMKQTKWDLKRDEIFIYNYRTNCFELE